MQYYLVSKIRQILCAEMAATGFTNSVALILIACKKMNYIIPNDEAAGKWIFVFFIALPFASSSAAIILLRTSAISWKQWAIYLSICLLTSIIWKLTESPQDMNMPLAMAVMNALFLFSWVCISTLFRRISRFCKESKNSFTTR